MKTLIRENAALANWTTFGLGGPARYFVEASTEQDVVFAAEFAKSHQLPLFVLGGGSNLLVADRGFPGVVLRVAITGCQWEAAGDAMELRAGAGEDWDGLVEACVERGLGGVECLSGIPGSAGGTPVQNVGAYGQETSEVLTGVRAFDRQTETFVGLAAAECGFSYRSSIFNGSARDRYIVLQVTYRLKRDPQPCIKYPDVAQRFEEATPPTLAEVRRTVREIRASKGMLIVEGDPDCRSAGSFFKNPVLSSGEFSRIQSCTNEAVPCYPSASGNVKTSAAWLIERAGFRKGFAMGPAAISHRHTLALINGGGATASDILKLARTIQNGVEQRFGIRLIPEPVFVGFDDHDPLGTP